MNFRKFLTAHSFGVAVFIIGTQSICFSQGLEQGKNKSGAQSNQTKTVKNEANSRSNNPKSPAGLASWEGEWSRSIRFATAGLEIKNLAPDKISFSLDATSGANTGAISGTAKVRQNKAFFADKTDLNKDETGEAIGCRITFLNQGNAIEVQASNDCSKYGGIGVELGGIYKKGPLEDATESLYDLKILTDKKRDGQFKKLVGEDYEKFAGSLQLVSEETDLDHFNAKVVSGCVSGLCPIMRAIIMYDNQNHFWAAVADVDAEKTRIFYYSNDDKYKAKLPRTIQKWLDEAKEENFKAEVIYKNKL